MPRVSRVPGTAVLDGGAKGVAIGFAEGGTRSELIFDQVSPRPLGTREVAVTASGDVPPGTVISADAFEFRIVNGVGLTD
ncbi:hypothetical protein [Rugosimonospora acidiphila]